MKPRSPIRKVSLKKEKELSGSGSFGLNFNSTIRRNTCDAMNAERNSIPRSIGAKRGKFIASDSATTANASTYLRTEFGKQRTPIRKQSESQRKRLQRLAAVRSRWWKESESNGKQLICGICDEPIRWFEDLASDHIEPGSAKSDEESNLQPAHASTCNLIKGSIRNFKIIRGDKNWKLIHGEL